MMREFNKMAVKLMTLVLLNAFVAKNAAFHGCPKSEIACLCGQRPNVEVNFFEIPPEFFYDELKDCQQLSSEVCTSRSCLPSPIDALDPDVDKQALKDDQVKVPFPPLDDDQDARESRHLLRDRRSTHKCSPPQVDHAEIKCYLWAEFTSCDVKCSRGYAFEEDGKMMLKTKRVCRESNPVWSPKNAFPVCKPYFNCRAVLVKPGKLTCYPGPGIPYCEISCKSDYENGYGEVAVGRYECVDERFAEILPHCATIDGNVAMMKPSENRQANVPQTG